MPSCAFAHCANNTRNTNKSLGISFHCFPKEKEWRQKWINLVRISRRDEFWEWTKYDRICSNHFPDSEFYDTKKGLRRINRFAVPVLPTYLQLQEQTRDNNCYNSGIEASNTSLILDLPKDDKPRKFENKLYFLKALKQKKINRKFSTLKSIVRDLMKQNMLTVDNLLQLEEKAERAEIVNRLWIKKSKYWKSESPQVLREFALLLHFYSAKAYIYVRRIYQTRLPHPKCLRKWYENANYRPGFTAQAFEALKLKSKADGKSLICTLLAEEIEIQQKTHWNGKRTIGLVNYGFGQSDVDGIAAQVYVFVLVCNDQNWKIPLGYFFVQGLPGSQRTSLISTCLQKCEDVGVDVVALTLKGCIQDIIAATMLGCQLDCVDNMKTTFKHPSNDKQVALFFDPSHMLKFVWHTWEAKDTIFDGDDQEIHWQLLKKLVEVQESEKTNVGNKLNQHYLQFRNLMLKIKLALQLMSINVVKALRMCKAMSIPMFQNVEPTANYIEKFHNLFNILNSHKLGQYRYNKPINRTNHIIIFKFLEEMELYILSLKIINRLKCTTKKSITIKTTKKNIIQCQCKTGFFGFLVCIKSLNYLYETLITSKRITNISTDKMNLYHLESLFGLGSHAEMNIVNTTQFRGIYRKVFSGLLLQPPFTRNGELLDKYQNKNDHVSCSGSQSSNEILLKHIVFPDSLEECENSITATDIQLETNASILAEKLDLLESDWIYDSEMCQYIVGYNAGLISRQLTKSLTCETCVNRLLSDEIHYFHKLIDFKTLDGLALPSKDLYAVCLWTEKCLRNYSKRNGIFYFCLDDVLKFLTNEILENFLNSNIFDSIHPFQHRATVSHRTLLMKTIATKYIRVRLHYPHKTYPAYKIHKRLKINKLVLFEGLSENCEPNISNSI